MNNKEFFNALLKAQGKLAVVSNAVNIMIGVDNAEVSNLTDQLVGPGVNAQIHVRQPKDDSHNVVIEITRCYETSSKYPYVYNNTENLMVAIPKEDIVSKFHKFFKVCF